MRSLTLPLGLLAFVLTSLPVVAREALPNAQPQHVVIQKGQICILTPENMLRRNEKISSYVDSPSLGNIRSFAVEKTAKGNAQAFFLRHPIRVAPLASYEIQGQINVQKMEGRPMIVMVEWLDPNREEYKSQEFALPEIPESGKWAPFSFKFSTERKTPWIRLWIVTDNKAEAKFFINDLRLVQTSEPRALEHAPLEKLEHVFSTSAEKSMPVPPEVSYAKFALHTKGRPEHSTEPLKIEFLADRNSQPLAIYELRWEPVNGIRGEWNGIAASWFESSKQGLGNVSFDRGVVTTGTNEFAEANWNQELEIPQGTKSLRILAKPGNERFQVIGVTGEIY